MHGRGGEPSRVGKPARSARADERHAASTQIGRVAPATPAIGSRRGRHHDGRPALDTPCVPAMLGEPRGYQEVTLL